MNIGEQIKARRTELNITQQDLADRLNVSRSAISNWETNKNYPDLQIIVQISEELQVSLDKLLKGDADVVKKISKDTTESRKLRGRTKKLIAALSVLAVMLLATWWLFFGWSGEVNKAKQVKDLRITDNELVIEVEVPNYYGRRVWYADIDETGTIAHITIDYHFGRAKDGKDIMTSPVNTDDDTDIFSKDGMKRLKEIQIVTSEGKVIRSLKVTDEKRE